MQQTLGQKFTSQANESLPSVQKNLRDYARECVSSALSEMEEFSSSHGLTYILAMVDTPQECLTIYMHRNYFVAMCLEFLPVDIGCTIFELDSQEMRFVVRFEVVQPYDGGQVHYDFPVYSYSSGSFVHNLAHLKKKALDQSDLVQAFEILVDMHLGRDPVLVNDFDQERAMEWGLENPSDILRVTDLEGFFEQFRVYGSREDIGVLVEPFVGGSQ